MFVIADSGGKAPAQPGRVERGGGGETLGGGSAEAVEEYRLGRAKASPAEEEYKNAERLFR